MLSGVRVVSREEATSHSQHKEECKFDGDRQRSKHHKKEEKRRGKRSAKKEALRKHDDSSSDSDEKKEKKKSKSRRKSRPKKGRYSDPASSSDTDSEELSSLSAIKGVSNEQTSPKGMDGSAAARKEVGLDWMVQPPPSSIIYSENSSKELQIEEESMQANPKELNPYLKDGGDGYPSEDFGPQNLGKKKQEAPIIGDGGLSWRLKALKRAKEQAEREGRKLDAVVEERWGSLADMTVSVSAKRAAHAHAHLHAIRDRKRSDSSKLEEKEEEKDSDLRRISTDRRDYLKDVSSRDSRMKEPNVTRDAMSWKRRQTMRVEDREIFHEAAAALNKFKNDGSFLETFSGSQEPVGAVNHQEHKGSLSKRTANDERQMERSVTSGAELASSVSSLPAEGTSAKQAAKAPQLRLQGKSNDELQMERSVTSGAELASSVSSLSTEGMSANQIAAKALQLRLQGKSNEADALLSRLQSKKNEEEELHGNETRPKQAEHQATYKRSLKSSLGDYSHRLGKSDSGDARLVDDILHNKQYNRSTCVDDEYESVSGDFKELESKKNKRKAYKDVQGKEAKQAIQAHKRIITQEERCQFCFNNPSRPKHLTVSIATSCYLVLPPWEPLVDGHCLLVPTQHEGSSRNVDDNVWEELRNYKKCLLQMFAKQDKEVLFLETVINLAQQRHHCLIECIPVPPNVAKQAPLYFKKAIDEAEDEWSQHDAKKLIDTSGKGLRACIPKNFPYFHVEFGLHAGFVHVIDNERDFKSDFGRNVVIGMLKLPEEEMHRRRKQQSYDQQKKAAMEFQKAWDPFDWTKMLD